MKQQTALCHLVDWQDISQTQCCSLQQKHRPGACFGCDSDWRLCVECRKWRPVCSELDLCGRCLNKALAREGFVPPDYDWQMCARCNKRRAYYSVYGLCLHCAAYEFAGIECLDSFRNGDAHVEEPEEPEVEEESVESLPPPLTDLEQVIVNLHQAAGTSMEQIGQLLGLSVEAVSQIHSQALQKTGKDVP